MLIKLFDTYAKTKQQKMMKISKYVVKLHNLSGFALILAQIRYAIDGCLHCVRDKLSDQTFQKNGVNNLLGRNAGFNRAGTVFERNFARIRPALFLCAALLRSTICGNHILGAGISTVQHAPNYIDENCGDDLFCRVSSLVISFINIFTPANLYKEFSDKTNESSVTNLHVKQKIYKRTRMG